MQIYKSYANLRIANELFVICRLAWNSYIGII